MAPHMCYLSPFLRATWLLYYSIPFLRCRIFHAGINFAISISLISSFNYCVFTASYITSSPLTPRYSIIFGPTILYNGHILFSHLNLYVLARNFHGTIMVLAKHKIGYTNHKMTIRNDNGTGCVWKMGHSYSPRMMVNFFLPHPCLLGLRKVSPHSVKLNFLLIFLQLLQLFLIKPIF